MKHHRITKKIQEDKIVKEISPNESMSDTKSSKSNSSNKSDNSERLSENDEEKQSTQETQSSSRVSETSKSTVESVDEIRSGSESRTSSSDSGSSNSSSNQSESKSVSSTQSSAEDDHYDSKEFIVEEKDKTIDSNNSNNEIKSINKSTSETTSNEEKEKEEKMEQVVEDKPIVKRKECKKKLARKTRKVIYVDEIPKEYAKFLKPVEDKNEKLNDLSIDSSKSPVKEIIAKSSSPISSSPKPKYRIIPCECPDCYWSKLIKDSSLQVFTI